MSENIIEVSHLEYSYVNFKAVDGVSFFVLDKPDQKWIIAEVKGTRIYAPDGTVITVEAQDEGGYVSDRKIFDQALAADAAHGAPRSSSRPEPWNC